MAEEKKKPGRLRAFFAAVVVDAGKGAAVWILGILATSASPFVTAYFLNEGLGLDVNGSFSLSQFFQDLYESPPPGTWLEIVFGKWWHSVLIFGGIGLAVGLILIGVRYQRRVRDYLRAFANAENAFETIGFHSVVMASEAQKAWDFLLADLRDPRTHTLSILGATGWETFAAVNSPLHEAIKKFSGEIRILLIDPRSAHLDKRAATVSSKPADYRRDIANSQTFIDDLKVRGANVDVRLYRDVPGWKLIITNNLCWMQYYSRNHHVAETPIYLFYNSNNAATLYHRFCWEFAKVWTGAPAKGRKPKA